MKNARLFLIIQSILYILLAGLLIAAVIGIYKDGAALRAEDPLAAIFSREIAAKALRKIAPAFFGAVGITVAGLILGVKSEEETGEETGDGSVSPVSWGKRRHRTVPCLLPEPSPGVFLILHAVMGGFAVELQGPDIVSVVEKPGNEIVHGIDGIFLCVMAQDDTGVLIGEI